MSSKIRSATNLTVILPANSVLMRLLPSLLLFTTFLIGCAGNDFDEATIPAEQLSAELAFRRVAEHGGLEPVLEEGTEFKDWQFHITSQSKTSVLGSDPVQTFNLADRSGIEYTVKSGTTPDNVLNQIELGYGYASGKILTVKRDLAAGAFEVELALTSWRERKK
jgi:hypothetical protein